MVKMDSEAGPHHVAKSVQGEKEKNRKVGGRGGSGSDRPVFYRKKGEFERMAREKEEERNVVLEIKRKNRDFLVFTGGES